jgi:FAD/FMN-containing dehydrogenase
MRRGRRGDLEVVRIANAARARASSPSSPEARRKFWLDRARTAAIAKHTNAFKINEDVVIPLERLGEYTDAIERINIELSIRNKLELLRGPGDYFCGEIWLGKTAEVDWAAGPRPASCSRAPRARWEYLLGAWTRRCGGARGSPPGALGIARAGRGRRQRFRPAAGPQHPGQLETEVRAELARIFAGEAFAQVLAECDAVHKRVLQGRVFVALHMHAGDGNVHTNIPVNSDNYAMLQTANRAVARIMRIARARRRDFRRARHRHHQARIPDRSGARAFRAYKQRIDPEGRFNKHKLMPGGDLRRAYTPSFGLLGHESLIMQQSDISTISDAIKDCLRCGKCKPVCATHVPRANLLYSPRDKILATSLLIEAFLYEEQTRRGVSIAALGRTSDVADHCTVCHKC